MLARRFPCRSSSSMPDNAVETRTYVSSRSWKYINTFCFTASCPYRVIKLESWLREQMALEAKYPCILAGNGVL